MIMPFCTNCNHELAGAEPHCPACGQPTGFPPPLAEPSTGKPPAELPLGEFFKAGWALFTRYPVGFVGFCLLYLVIQAALQGVPYVGVAASFAVSTPLLMGNFIVSGKLLQGQTPEFRDFFLGFQFFLPLLLLSLVAGIIVGIGMVLLIIPGIYLIVAYMFASYLVVDRGLDFWPAMELSRRTIHPRWFSYFVFALLVLVLNLAGAVALGVGLLVTLPLSFCTITVAYGKIFGMRSDYSGGAVVTRAGG
jgi:uncharacterized membrane protein